MAQERVLVIGSSGQLGTELVQNLRNIYGVDNVLATDIRQPEQTEGPFKTLDILDKENFKDIIQSFKPNQVYHLAALLSATAEQKPKLGWTLNMDGLFHVLDSAKEQDFIKKIYWPSSIAVFGPNTPRKNTPQHCIMDPNTIYGISKLAGERYCEYYHEKYDVDVRSLRYPGLIGYKSMPGGGTTDYAVSIYHEALKEQKYSCFLAEDTYLPMAYMPDAIRATLELMHTDTANVKIRSSYNLAGISFSPKEITQAIQSIIPAFSIDYKPDYRQAIADSWPQSINDLSAQKDWNWSLEYDLPRMTEDMLQNLSGQYNVTM
jgi:nucleoside-diphosphate-sugar epimerase